MIRKSILALATVGLLMGFTGAALVAKSFTTSRSVSQAYGYDELINRPIYLKGKVLEDCLENPAECALLVW
jgi:hypothetical protein